MLVEIPDDFFALMKETAECETKNPLGRSLTTVYNIGVDNGSIYYARCILDKLGINYDGKQQH